MTAMIGQNSLRNIVSLCDTDVVCAMIQLKQFFFPDILCRSTTPCSLYVQVGIVSVALCAPSVEGSYTSHWRLAHAGEQFGPRVWCSIVVDNLAPAPMMADGILVSPCVTPQVRKCKESLACE